MGGFLLLPEDELILIAHLLDAEGLTLLASDDLADGPQELDVLTGPLSLPTPPRPNTDPTEPPHFTFWAHQLGPLRPWADAPQPTTFSERVHRLVNEESVPDFESLLDDERSPILRWSRASWHDSGALCPGLLQGQARPSAQQPSELRRLHARVQRWRQREGVALNPFEHAPDELPVEPPRNVGPFRCRAPEARFRRQHRCDTAVMTAPLLAVEDAVRAVVDHDDERLAVIAPDAGDLYQWTRDYGSHGTLELVLPPGTSQEWDIEWTDMRDGGKHVAVGMWTRQEGRSDLTLELHLHRDHDGRWLPRVLHLHVL